MVAAGGFAVGLVAGALDEGRGLEVDFDGFVCWATGLDAVGCCC